MWQKPISALRILDVDNIATDFPALKACLPITEAAVEAAGTISEIVSGGSIPVGFILAGPDAHSKQIQIATNQAISGFAWPNLTGKATLLVGVFDDVGASGLIVGSSAADGYRLQLEASNAGRYIIRVAGSDTVAPAGTTSITWTKTGGRCARALLLDAANNNLYGYEYNAAGYGAVIGPQAVAGTPAYGTPAAVATRLNAAQTGEDYLYQLWQFDAKPHDDFVKAVLTWAYDNAINGYKAPYPALLKREG